MSNIPEESPSSSMVSKREWNDDNREYWPSLVQARVQRYEHASSLPGVHPDVLRTARSALSAEIEGLEHAVILAKSSLSNMSPVHKLPPEVLGKCFTALMVQSDPQVYTRRATDDDTYGNVQLVTDLGWISVTRVCRKWRHVALAQASLWGTIPFCLGPMWVTTFIERVLSCPLDIQLGADTPLSLWNNHQDMLDTILDIIRCHLFHIKRIIVSGIEYKLGDLGEPFFQNLTDVLTDRTPMLHSIELISDGFDFSFPPNFLHHAPHLASVTVCDCDTTWTSTSFRNLTSLDITPGPRLSAYDPLMVVLRSNPTLEVLRLWGALPLRASTSAVGAVITLRHLTTLDLGEESVTVLRHLFETLVIPPKCVLNLTEVVIDTEVSLKDCLSLITIMSAHINRHDKPIREFLLRDFTEPSHTVKRPIQFIAWRDVKYFFNRHSTRELDHGKGAVLNFGAVISSQHVDAASGEAWKQKITLSLLQHLSLSSVEVLGIERNCDLVASLLPDLQSMWNIRYLSFDGDTFESMQRLLTATMTDSPHGIMLPHLFSLLTHKGGWDVSYLSESSVVAILDTLRKRRDLGVPIQEFFLSGCSLNPADEATLREIVPTVVLGNI
ncbi:uncharacterized protein STEHIDRAFT_111408 [Stereum hirsutum FP-91666 SS1]|uniref:uncharacterized protein n=1 Tax=Stereum hirsutum (strain FP-91666) TaxID=721885 RepID=UPI000444982E|nr:uncharacterized protein STEHIDRAFT_111408 [Stereum hirsutum FP-91666 SS1]EIM85778.1 hypothetical protein STEHIDRAFT_111408 [Stereum hirsutum FP-91666 SS1]